MKKILSANPLMEWVCNISARKRKLFLAVSILVVIVYGILYNLSSPEIHKIIVWFLPFFPTLLINVLVYVLLGFNKTLKQKTKNIIGTIVSCYMALVILFLFIFNFILFSTVSNGPVLATESTAPDNSCTIQVYKTRFHFMEGFDAEVYVEWADSLGEKEHVTSIKKVFSTQVMWYDNNQGKINTYPFIIENGKMRFLTD